MEKLVILDFGQDTVDIYDTEFHKEPCMEDLLEFLGHRASDCQWIFCNGNMTFHGEVLKDET